MNSLLSALSPSQLRKAAALKEKINDLEAELQGLLGAPEQNRLVRSGIMRVPANRSRTRRKMSPQARAKIAAAAKARWKKAKAAGKNSL